jgi:hypothetical protein
MLVLITLTKVNYQFTDVNFLKIKGYGVKSVTHTTGLHRLLASILHTDKI